MKKSPDPNEDKPNWYRIHPDGLELFLQIQPRASRSQFCGTMGEPPRLKVRIAAPPVEGEANEELVRFIGKTLGIAPSRIHIRRGHSGKLKDIWCETSSEDALKILDKLRF